MGICLPIRARLMSNDLVSGQTRGGVSPCEEFGAVIEEIYQHLITETLDEYLSADLWRDLDILRAQCAELSEELQAKFDAIRHASSGD